MQTFLPYPDFTESMSVLDMKRLGKQRVETLQILRALKTGQGWIHHPATLMWENFELALLHYQEASYQEWVGVRGYKDTCWEKSKALFTNEELDDYEAGNYENPEWLGWEEFHAVHQANLVRKAPEIYSHIFPDVEPQIGYIWPGKTREESQRRNEYLP